MLTPMRSFTLAHGFWLSSFATTSATHPAVTLLSRTSGVLPINSVTSLAIFMVSFLQIVWDGRALSPPRLLSYWPIVDGTTCRQICASTRLSFSVDTFGRNAPYFHPCAV